MDLDSKKQTPWGDKWRDAVSRAFAAYALTKSVAGEMDISGRTLKAKVVDGSWNVYKTVVVFSRLSDSEESLLMDALGKNEKLARQLSRHVQAKETLDFVQGLGVRMFPERGMKFSVKCSCGALGMCEHVYASILAVGKKVDREPFTLFSIRGLDIFSLAEQCLHSGLENALSSRGKKGSISAFDEKFVLRPIENQKSVSKISDEDFLRIPDVRNETLSALIPNRDFDAKFVNEYREALSELFERDFERYPEMSVDLEEDRYVHYRGNARWFFGKIPLEWALDAVSVEGPSGLARDSESARILSGARNVALKILQSGAVYPKIFTSDDGNAYAFWLPLKSIPEVQKNLELFDQRIPPKFVRSNLESPKVYVENAAEMLVIAILSAYLKGELDCAFRNELSYVLFGDASIRCSTTVAESNLREFEDWISIYEISDEPFLPIVNGADAGFGKIDVDLDFIEKSTGEVYPLSKLWTRDFPDEKRNSVLHSLQPIRPYIKGYDEYISGKATDNIHLSDAGMVQFLNESVPLFRAVGVSLELPKGLERILRGVVRPQIVRSEEKARAGFSRLENLLQFNWSVFVGDRSIDGKAFLESSERLGGLQYDGGQYFYVSPEDISLLKEGLRDRFKIPAIQVLQIALAGEFDGLSVDIAPEALSEIHRFKKESEANVDVPPQIRATLRPYQKRGFAWMLGNSKLGFGSIIADDMGLGKTLQVITLLQQLKNDGALDEKKALVVVPSGLLQNWRRELGKFSPELRVIVYHGINRTLENSDADIFLTTYGILRSDGKKLKDVKWQVVVIDEAQNIKNAGTAQTRAVKALSAHIKIAMSGTPVENRLMEFWSIMDFCNHGLLGNAKSFREEFEKPIQNLGNRHLAELFQKITAPFLLRRLKTDKAIITDLPEKLEQNDWASLSPEQSKLYGETYDRFMEEIQNLDPTDPGQRFERGAKILQLILALKKICNHPAQYLKDENFSVGLSGKTELFIDILSAILDTDEKVLVFTQFTEMGTILEKIIQKELKTESLFYHGALSLAARENVISEFETDPSRRILILSLKAGGTGLNLTAASQVVHYDLWWNPAVEAQATDRAYRIGQNRRVVVHRLITKDTFEERINEIIDSKRKISEMTVSTGENWIARLSDDELREIFTLGKS